MVKEYCTLYSKAQSIHLKKPSQCLLYMYTTQIKEVEAKHNLQVCGSKRLSCHAGREEVADEVNLRNPLHAGKGAHKPRILPGFETQGRRH